MPILSVRSALPGHRYPQQQLTDAFARVVAVQGGFDEAVLRRLHRNAGVESDAFFVIGKVLGSNRVPIWLRSLE